MTSPYLMSSADADWVRLALAACGPRVLEVNSVFAVPYTQPPWGGDDHIRYDCVATRLDGEVYLRSHGVGFNIVPKPWLGQQIDGCYSIGPGLVGERQCTVVLAQVFRVGEEALRLLADDSRWLESALVASVRRYGSRCTLLSGYL
jgi:hypothetical protein